RAGRILGEHLTEGLLSLGVPERVQHRDGALEALLHCGATGILEVDLAKLILGLRLPEDRNAEQQENQQHCDGPVRIHRASCPIRNVLCCVRPTTKLSSGGGAGELRSQKVYRHSPSAAAHGSALLVTRKVHPASLYRRSTS